MKNGLTEGKNVSVRLPRHHLNIVMGLANVDHITIGEVVRNAIVAYQEQRRSDPDFVERVEEAKRELHEILADTLGTELKK